MPANFHLKAREKHSVLIGQPRFGVRIVILTLLNLFVSVGLTPGLFAQLPPVIDPTGRSGEPPVLEKQQQPAPTSPPRFILPPVETLPELQPKRTPGLKVRVQTIRVEGSTVFSQEELAKITAPYENRELSTEDLEQLRRELTQTYINKGYINSGAVIPDQSLEDGQLTYRIIEGKLTDINIEGTTYFLPFYFQQRIARSTGPPLNIRPLKERLQLLLQDSRIQRLNSELKPGLTPGEAILNVRVEEASPFRAWAEFNNFQSPTVGAERGLGTIAVDNPFAIGDHFQFTYGGSKGVNPLLDTSYSVPLTPWDTTLQLQYRKNDFNVVSSAFKQLDIESQSQIFKISLRQPLYHTLTDEVAVTFIGEHLQNQNFIDGRGFQFTPGTTQNGKSKISALRLAQEWIHRQEIQVFAFYSRFSLGVDALNATNNRIAKHDPDSHFFAWLGQAQWARRIDPLGIQLISNLALQVANDSLFPLEQFAVGGRYSVRGYRENQLVRDNAFLFSVESRIPVLPSVMSPHVTAHFAPFIDVGRSWNAKIPTPDPTTLASIGVGLRLGFFGRAFANVYWGQQLNHVSDVPPGGNLQDHGLHVQFILNIL
jgi:hemolysin activation/secretion protein